MSSTALVPEQTLTTGAEPNATWFKRKARWFIQGHVRLGVVLMAKLIWFDVQVPVPLTSPGKWFVTLGTVLLLVCGLPLLRPVLRLLVGLAIDFVVTTLVLADLVYFRFFDGLLTISIFGQAGQ